MLPHPIPNGALPPPTPDEIKSALALETMTIEWLAGDGSDRSYYRIQSPEIPRPVVLMQLSGADARALQQGRYDWIEIADTLANFNIRVPKLVRSMPEQAAIIIEDYGNLMLETKVLEFYRNGDTAAISSIYDASNAILIHFLEIPVPGETAKKRPVWTQRAFDSERFEWELNFFLKKFVEPVARINLDPTDRQHFDREVKSLSSYLANLPQHFVHRDFHSRNLMLFEEQLAVIDFQDARLGPASYDAVSLCFDSYIPLDATERQNLFAAFLKQVETHLGAEKRHEIELQWRAVLLQRQLKALGSFGYLTIEKNKGNYLKYVAPALETLRGAQVTDKRWPLLSQNLLGALERAAVV